MRQELKEFIDRNAKRYLIENFISSVVDINTFVEEVRKELPGITDDELREAIPYISVVAHK